MHPFSMEEHPSDAKLRAYGSTRAEAFRNAARGMMVFLYGEEALACRPDQVEEITVASSDAESLLVDWLSELLYRSNALYRAYPHIEILSLEANRLSAKVGSCALPARDDIKAVTHHELELKETPEGWEAAVVFDV